MLQRRHQRKPVLLDIAPMVDVMLILVVFFLLNSQSEPRSFIPILLPESDTAEADAGQREGVLEIRIDRNDHVVVDGAEIDLTALEEMAASYARVVVFADEQSTYGIYSDVVDALRRAEVPTVHRAARSMVERW